MNHGLTEIEFKELTRICERFKDQDTACTENPIYQVRQKTQIMSYDSEHSNVVQSFVTKQAAERYLKSNSHNINRGYIYVETSYRNYEMATIISILPKLLKAINGDGNEIQNI